MSKWFDGVLRSVPGVPVQNDVPGVDEMTENALEHFEERSAIAEFDGGLPRTEAERQAASRVFGYRLAGWPSHQWGILLMQPGDGLADAEAWCRERFGGKFIAARRYRPGGGA